MPHIHTGKNQHDLTVTAYIVRVDRDEPMVLVHVHKKYGVLLPVGGHVELDETPWQAIAHELEEESGYTLDQLKLVQPNSRLKKISMAAQHPYPLVMNTHDVPVDHYHTDISYGFVTEGDPRLEIVGDESHDLRWLTRAELNSKVGGNMYANTREIYNFLFDEALPHWDRIDTNGFLLEYPASFLNEPV
jgi:8-oxo-dGTP diphosphatase